MHIKAPLTVCCIVRSEQIVTCVYLYEFFSFLKKIVITEELKSLRLAY